VVVVASHAVSLDDLNLQVSVGGSEQKQTVKTELAEDGITVNCSVVPEKAVCVFAPLQDTVSFSRVLLVRFSRGFSAVPLVFVVCPLLLSVCPALTMFHSCAFFPG
jgi:hypothetical protein